MKLLLAISMVVSMNIFSDLSNAVIIDVRSESEWNEDTYLRHIELIGMRSLDL